MEYPKKCTKAEAISWVKSGGRARVRGMGSNGPWTIIRLSPKGRVRFKRFDGSWCYSKEFLSAWEYEMVSPHSSPSKSFTTPEAIVEVCTHKRELHGRRVGDTDPKMPPFILGLDSDGDITCRNILGQSLEFIPGDAVWGEKETEKPEPIKRGCIVDPDERYPDISQDISKMQAEWDGRVQVSWVVEAVS